MRWDEIIDPRLAAYRRNVVSASAMRTAMGMGIRDATVYSTPHDEPDDSPFLARRDDLARRMGLEMKMTPEQLEQARKTILAALDIPPEMVVPHTEL